MAAKRKPKSPRAIPRQFRSGAEEQAATAGDRFYFDLDDTRQFHVIRDRETGEVFARPTLSRTECYHEVAQRNAGMPLNRVSQGKLLKSTRRIKADPNAQLTNATEWVEWLMNNPPTVEALQSYKPTGQRTLSSEDLEGLMRDATNGVDFDDKMVAAVMQQLYRNFKIGHKR